MKIAFVTPHFYPHIGGVETVVMQLATHLAAKGIDVTVLTQTSENKLPKVEKLHNFTILRFGIVGFSELKASFSLLRYLQKHSNQYDLIHVHNYHSFPTIAVAFTKKTPIIFSPHYHGTGHTFLTRPLHRPYRYFGGFILSKSDAIICVTNAESKLVKRDFPYISEPIIIPLAIDVKGIQESKKYKATKKYILSVGRLENYKNIGIIIKSLQFLDNNIHLKIVGSGPAKVELYEIVQKLDFTGRISFLSNVDNDKLYQLFKGAETYVTMSRLEAYGLSLLEAVAAKTGVIASDIPAHRELVNKFKIKNVSLLPLDSSPKDLADAIFLAMTNKSHTAMALPTWKSVTEKALRIYKKVLNKKS